VDRQGVVELATLDETVAGKDAVRAVTPAGLVPAMAKSIDNHKAAPDPHPGYLTPERANALYFRKLPAISNSDTDCDTLLETGVRDVLVANDRGIIAATHLPVGGDGFGTLTTVNGGNFIRQVYTEGGTIQRTWERTGFAGATPPFNARNWKLLWDSVTFDPASKQNTLGYSPVQQGTGIGQLPNIVKIGWSNGSGVRVTVDATDMGSVVFGAQSIRLNWSGFGGQPSWLFGGNSPDAVNVFNPANFSVNYANSAGYATSTGNADKVGGIPMRHQENADQCYYVYGRNGGTAEITLFNRNTFIAGYANQLTGPGLQNQSIGSYMLNKNYTNPEAGGAWELRGYAYDFGSGGDGGIGSRTALWQRVA
jgi:hypothetical protein